MSSGWFVGVTLNAVRALFCGRINVFRKLTKCATMIISHRH